MCLALPAEIIELLPEDRAIISLGGIEKEISTALVDRCKVGDYVVVHVGYALTRLNEFEAKKTLEIYEKL